MKISEAKRASPYFFFAAFLLSLAAFFFAAQSAAIALFQHWTLDEYSHGPLIVLLSLYIGWHALAGRKIEIRPSFGGVVLLLVSSFLLLLSRLSAFNAPAYYGMVLFPVGLCAAFFGTKHLRLLAPAFIYPFFAIPLPYLLYNDLSASLQLASSWLGVQPLFLAGIPVFQEGNIIDLGDIKLQVAEACSGLRYLFPLMSFGYLAAFLLKGQRWKKIVIFFSTVPIAIFMNAARIALIGFTVSLWGKSAAEGIVHDFEGWVVFAGCIGLLALEWKILGHIGARLVLKEHLLALPRQRVSFSGAALDAPNLIFLLLCLMLAGLLGFNFIDRREEIVPPHPSFERFPLQMAPWRGRTLSMDDITRQKLKLTDYFWADFIDQEPTSPPVSLYMAYYARQRVGATLHAPTNCISGSGWKIQKEETKNIRLSDGQEMRVARLLIGDGKTRQVVYYWFDQQGRKITNPFTVRLYLFWDSLFKNRSDGTLVRFSTPVPEKGGEEEADRKIAGFLDAARPVLSLYLAGPVL